MDGRLLNSVPEAMDRAGGISRSKIYQLIRDKELCRVKIGARSFITESSLRAFVDRLVEAAS
jgi:predicted DNA-binding transcriptional regulator AlpA